MVNPRILLHPNIPKPLHGLNPRTILGEEWWNTKREEAYRKYDYHCWACGIHKSNAQEHQWLEGHEAYIIDYTKGSAELKEIVALCHYCHNYIHSGRMQMMVKSGEMSQEKYDEIIKHGESILTEAGLPNRPAPINTKIAGWKKWHLVIDGGKYFTRFTNQKEWSNFYRRTKVKEVL